MQTPDTPAPTTEKDLDKALRDTFPASDPVSATVHLTATPTADHVAACGHGAGPAATIAVYRVVDASQREKPFSTAGSSDGRWTSAQTPAVYAALSPAAALLEFLAHCDGTPPPTAFLARAHLPRDRVTVLQAYPSTWRERPYRAEVQQVGDAWSASHQSLAVQVPSALCDDSLNVIINPNHVDAPLVQGVQVSPIEIDDRLRRIAGR